MDAIEGEEASELGPRIFDLSPKGCNLRIKVEKQGDYPTYVSSKFSTPKEIEGLDEDSYDKIYKSAFDLETYITVKPYDELKDLLDTHYHGVEHDEVETPEATTNAPVPSVSIAKKVTPKTSRTDEDDSSINELLKDL
jgi:hypothetical protein